MGSIKSKLGLKGKTKPGQMISRMNEMKNSRIKKSGTFKGKSNKLGYGGRAAQLKSKGVPGGVIGNLARKAQAAKGQKNYHGKNYKIMN